MWLVILSVGTLVLAATASPTSHGFDFRGIESAGSPRFTGPPAGAASQTAVYNQHAAIINAFTTSIPAVQGSCDDGHPHSTWRTSSYCKSKQPSTSYCESTTTASPTTTAPTTTSTLTRPSTTVTVPSSCVPISYTNTNSFTSTSSCPTPFEVGTYCGFVNPQDPCAPQPGGYGPRPTPDTATNFANYKPFHSLAFNAPTPDEYAQSFEDLNAAVNANTYLGYKVLESYNVYECADFCNNNAHCTGFNIYIERDPSINPGECSCKDPPSITNFKCSIWGSGVNAAAATNYGQNRAGFEVVIVASNGYSKVRMSPLTTCGWGYPQDSFGMAHNHPESCLGHHYFPGPFDSDLCAALADSWNEKHRCWPSGYAPANFFNAFMLTKNGIPMGTYCNLFSEWYNSSTADFVPGWHDGSFWGVDNSWGFQREQD